MSSGSVQHPPPLGHPEPVSDWLSPGLRSSHWLDVGARFYCRYGRAGKVVLKDSASISFSLLSYINNYLVTLTISWNHVLASMTTELLSTMPVICAPTPRADCCCLLVFRFIFRCLHFIAATPDHFQWHCHNPIQGIMLLSLMSVLFISEHLTPVHPVPCTAHWWSLLLGAILFTLCHCETVTLRSRGQFSVQTTYLCFLNDSDFSNILFRSPISISWLSVYFITRRWEENRLAEKENKKMWLADWENKKICCLLAEVVKIL